MKVELKVPYVKQISDKTCLPACAEMILKYYGEQATQRELYEKAKWGEGEGYGATDAGLAVAIRDLGYKVISWWNAKQIVPTSWKILEDKYFWPQFWVAAKIGAIERKENADSALIKELIDIRIPVIVDVDNGKLYDGETTWTHSILFTGYSNRHLIYHDPSEKGGPEKRIEVKKLEDCWITPFVDKSMRIIVKQGRKIQFISS